MSDPTRCDRCGLHTDPTNMVQGVCDKCTGVPTSSEWRALREVVTYLSGPGVPLEVGDYFDAHGGDPTWALRRLLVKLDRAHGCRGDQ